MTNHPFNAIINQKGGGNIQTSKIILAFFCIIAILLTSVSCTGSNKTENVFDQLYYEVKSIKKGNDSILLTGTKTAFADYDLGSFENIQIPDLDMCLDFDEKSLYILFFNHGETENWNTSFCVLYRYDICDKKLYGEKELNYLNDNFLLYYFEWCNTSEETNVYSLQNLGNYTFTLQEQVNYN